ncbi:T-cell surface glycoprotein CD3 gamma chain-like [Engystomops pustulosus]|uniref:T-cell surface glycoprotein CD3 gamma chain-like n=1 Tax=Engystomops pustulosus TaxID=76066 RepID=UPI003AFA8DE8
MVTSHIWLVVAFFIHGVLSQAEDKDSFITGVEKDDHLTLKFGTECSWEKDGEFQSNGTELKLGSLWNDPRGVYCAITDKTKKCVNVYVRRCLNCIQLDAGTIAGFVVADVIMIGLIATAVYFVSGSETRRPGRASDKQNLIESETAYQVLRHRDNDAYSHLAPRPKRGGF